MSSMLGGHSVAPIDASDTFVRASTMYTLNGRCSKAESKVINRIETLR